MTTIILPPVNREAMVARIAAFLATAFPGKPVKVEIAEKKKSRSDAQNRYLWGVVYPTLRDATGQSCDDWHEFFLGEWAGWETVELFGRKRLKPVRRSSKLTVMEFADYIGFIQMRAAEHSIFIADPDPR
jgi:hypothetical protein